MATVQSNSDRPWMTALEMQFVAKRHATAAALSSDPRLKLHRGMIEKAFAYLPNAIPYVWSSQTQAAALTASRTIPAETRLSPDMLPAAVWWWLADPIPPPPNFASSGMDSAETHTCAILIYKGLGDDGSEAIGIVAFGPLRLDTGALSPTPIANWSWRVGTSVADLVSLLSPLRDKDDPTVLLIGTLSRFVVAALAWLEQRILLTGSGHIERHRRKQLVREHDVVVSDVKVITLRRAEYGLRESDNDNEHTEWSCRWIVNGHWRNQPYANGERKLIYILPYVKGPDDKPLKVPTHTVYSVNR